MPAARLMKMFKYTNGVEPLTSTASELSYCIHVVAKATAERVISSGIEQGSEILINLLITPEMNTGRNQGSKIWCCEDDVHGCLRKALETMIN